MPEAAWPYHRAFLLWLMRASRVQAHSNSFQPCMGPALWHCIRPRTYNPTAQSLPNWKSSQHASGSCRQASYFTETKSQKTQIKKKVEELRVDMNGLCHWSWDHAGIAQRGSMRRSEAPSLSNLSFSNHSIIHIFILLRCFTKFSWVRAWYIIYCQYSMVIKFCFIKILFLVSQTLVYYWVLWQLSVV